MINKNARIRSRIATFGRRVVAMVLAISIAFATVLSGNVMTAYGAKTNKVTITEGKNHKGPHNWNTHEYKLKHNGNAVVAVCIEGSKASPGGTNPKYEVENKKLILAALLTAPVGKGTEKDAMGAYENNAIWKPITNKITNKFFAVHAVTSYINGDGISKDFLTLYKSDMNKVMDNLTAWCDKNQAILERSTLYVTKPGDNKIQGVAWCTTKFNSPGRIKLIKKSEHPELTNNNSAYDLTGAKYGIYKNEACTKRVDTLTVENNKGETGISTKLKVGKYYVKEVKGTATGYKINPTVRAISVTSGKTTSETLDHDMLEPILDDPIYLLVQKGISNLSEAGKGEGDVVNLGGVKFRVDYYAGMYNSAAAAKSSGSPKYSAVFATDYRGLLLFREAKPVDGTSWGYKKGNGENALPLGTVVITEDSSIDGLIIKGEGQVLQVVDGGNGNAAINCIGEWPTQNSVDTNAVGAYLNTPKLGGFKIGKTDKETKQYLNLGGADLAGTTYEIINKSKKSVTVGNKEYNVNEVVQTIVTEYVDGKYVATTGNSVLPYGTYCVREIKAGKGYLLTSGNKADVRTFTIREDGQMVDWTGIDKAYSNPVAREDWHFQKKAEDTMKDMDTIAFLVTSDTTGEKHVIVTDENGTWGSARTPHSNDTNANDPTAVNTNGAITVDADGNWVVKDSSKLDSEAGTWFTGVDPKVSKWTSSTEYDVNGVKVSVQDDLRSFPYDTYTVEELRCANNKGYDLVTFPVTLHEYGNHDGIGLDIDYGTVYDTPISIGTTLAYGESGKVAPVASEVKLTDTVSYEGLAVGTEYTMKGELHGVDAEGKDVGVIAEGETVFTANKATGKVEVEFVVDTSKLGGQSVVAFEYLYDKGAVVTDHEDIEDKDQTVIIPEISTTLIGDIEHEANGSAEKITLTDTVSYKNLEVGKHYVMNGALMDKATGKDVVDKDGNVITASTQFAPSKTEGTVDVVFTFTGVEVVGKTFVAFESVSQNGVEYAVHADIDDDGQTVTFPDVHTTATNKVGGGHEIIAAKEQVIVDNVALKNLVVGKEYIVTGTLHIKNADGTDGGVLKDANNKDVTASTVFTADKSDMSVDIKFTIDASALAGKDIVAFETLSRDGITLGVHADITDKKQTIYVPKIGTTALDGVSGTHNMSDGTHINIVDEVAYSNLTVGDKYTVSGALHVQKVDKKGNITDGGVLKNAEGKDVVASTEFVAEKANGTVSIVFDFDIEAGALDGSTLVAFEDIKNNDLLIATHSNIEDAGQSVHKMKVGTNLTGADGKAKYVQFADKVELIDIVEFENLVIGEEYTLKGVLVDGEGKALKDADGKDIVAEAKFIPEEVSGKAEMLFTVDTSKMKDKGKIVAYEYVYSANGTLVGKHEDLSDENQTVIVTKDSSTHVDLQTGIDNYGLIVALGMLLLAAGALFVYIRKRREA